MITIVSGLPRSGTSLMMQMLQQGGMTALTDDQRKADPNNPKGYLEYEKVKALKKDNTWLPEAEGKVVKIISHLITELPTDLSYQIVFMTRNLDEVIASQSSMLDRLGRQGAPVTTVELKRVFQKHLDEVKAWLARSEAFKVVYIDHRDLVTHPEQAVEQVNAFLGGGLDTAAMLKMVDPNLYRERAST